VGVFLCPVDGIAVGWPGLGDRRRLRLKLEGDRKDFLREPVRGAIKTKSLSKNDRLFVFMSNPGQDIFEAKSKKCTAVWDSTR